MADARPNVLVLLTDEERYPPPYEGHEVASWRRTALPGHERLRARGVEAHRHHVAATACLPSRASLFTGHYPSLHGVVQTDGVAKSSHDPAMRWLDPDGVPTMGDWFRAAGYRTEYRGKWHVSHADLLVGRHQEGLRTNDRDGSLRADAVEAYRRADRLDPFGFGGWIGREPHGADPADTGYVRDPLFADQVCDLLASLAADPDDRPWLAVASFVNPHDIAFTGGAWDMFGFPPVPDSVPAVPEPPSQRDRFDGRPAAQAAFHRAWSEAVYPQPTDEAYRRFYLWLHQLVDVAIDRVLDALAASGMDDDTIVVLTSDHGDMVGAHGGMMQKWHVAFDEATRVPLVVSGPGIEAPAGGISMPTSHIDLLPTLLGLADVDVERATAAVAEHHIEVRPLVGRDLSALLTGSTPPPAEPLYFMTDDAITNGDRQVGMMSQTPYDGVPQPSRVEAVIAERPTDDGGDAVWKLAHTYDRLPEWEAEHGLAAPGGTSTDEWELYCVTSDPDERSNLVGAGHPAEAELRSLLDAERARKRLVPTWRNPR